MIIKLKSFVLQSHRVWSILKKPSAFEFKSIAKVSVIGMLILAALGFIISDLMKIIGNSFG